MVVDPDRLVNSSARVEATAEIGTEPVLLFEDAIQPFSVGVFVAVVFLGHTDWKASTAESLNEVVTAVLASSIRVVDRISITGQICKGPVECDEVGLGISTFAAVVANDLPGVQVHDEGQVLESHIGTDVGDIADPDEIGSRRLKVTNQVSEQREIVP